MLVPRRGFFYLSGAFVLRQVVGTLSATPASHQGRDFLVNAVRKIGRKSSKTLHILYPKGSLANLVPISRGFEKLSGTSIKLVEASLDEISSEIILGNKLNQTLGQFDVALPPTFSVPDLVEAGTILDLTPYAREYEPQSFRDSYLYTHGDKYLGKLYGYQTDGDIYLLFLRRSWLENQENKQRYKQQFGTNLEVPKTWQQLDQQIAFFYRPEKSQYGGNLFRNKNYLLWEFWIRLHAAGVLPFDDAMQPQLHMPPAVGALEQLLSVSKYLDPIVFKQGLFENFQRFGEGNGFCNLGWGGTQKYLNGPKSAVRGDLIITPTPGNVFGNQVHPVSYFNWGWNFVVSQKSPQAELAYLFCLYACSPAVSTAAVREAGGYFDPYRQEHYDDAKIRSIYSQEFLDAHKVAMASAIPDLYLRGQGLYLSALKQALHLAQTNRIAPKAALHSASQKWNQITEKLGKSQQHKQWHSLRSLYPKFFKT